MDYLNVIMYSVFNEHSQNEKPSVTFYSHLNVALPLISRNISQQAAKYSFIRSRNIEDNKSDMSTDPAYIKPRGEDWV